MAAWPDHVRGRHQRHHYRAAVPLVPRVNLTTGRRRVVATPLSAVSGDARLWTNFHGSVLGFGSAGRSAGSERAARQLYLSQSTSAYARPRATARRAHAAAVVAAPRRSAGNSAAALLGAK